MTVSELIVELYKLPGDARIAYVWDGRARSNVNNVWLSREGRVILSDVTSQVDGDEDWPEGIRSRHELLALYPDVEDDA